MEKLLGIVILVGAAFIALMDGTSDFRFIIVIAGLIVGIWLMIPRRESEGHE